MPKRIENKQTNNEKTNDYHSGTCPYDDNANIRPKGDDQERNCLKRKSIQESPTSMERKESCLLWRFYHRPKYQGIKGKILGIS